MIFLYRTGARFSFLSVQQSRGSKVIDDRQHTRVHGVDILCPSAYFYLLCIHLYLDIRPSRSALTTELRIVCCWLMWCALLYR